PPAAHLRRHRSFPPLLGRALPRAGGQASPGAPGSTNALRPAGATLRLSRLAGEPCLAAQASSRPVVDGGRPLAVTSGNGNGGRGDRDALARLAALRRGDPFHLPDRRLPLWPPGRPARGVPARHQRLPAATPWRPGAGRPDRQRPHLLRRARNLSVGALPGVRPALAGAGDRRLGRARRTHQMDSRSTRRARVPGPRLGKRAATAPRRGPRDNRSDRRRRGASLADLHQSHLSSRGVLGIDLQSAPPSGTGRRPGWLPFLLSHSNGALLWSSRVSLPGLVPAQTGAGTPTGDDAAGSLAAPALSRVLLRRDQDGGLRHDRGAGALPDRSAVLALAAESRPEAMAGLAARTALGRLGAPRRAAVALHPRAVEALAGLRPQSSLGPGNATAPSPYWARQGRFAQRRPADRGDVLHPLHSLREDGHTAADRASTPRRLPSHRLRQWQPASRAARIARPRGDTESHSFFALERRHGNPPAEKGRLGLAAGRRVSRAQGWIFSCRFNISINFWMRFARVSGFVAV